MTQDQQLKLQAFLDGELPEAEAREVANWIARDHEAAGLHTELKNTRQALGGFEAGIKLPESREFYWSKIEREIRRLEAPQPAERSPAPTFWLWRVLVPASAIAVVAIAAMIALKDANPARARRPLGLQTALADSGAFTYRDEQEGMTLVWLSYGENGLANGSAPATLQ